VRRDHALVVADGRTDDHTPRDTTGADVICHSPGQTRSMPIST